MSPAELLAAFDAEVRRRPPTDDPAYLFEQSSGVWRLVGPTAGFGDNTVIFADLAPQDIGAAVERMAADYRARGHAFEWKVYGHDRTDPSPALLDRGFEACTPETLLILDLQGPHALAVRDLPGIAIARMDDTASLESIHDVQDAVWDDDSTPLIASLTHERSVDPRALSVWQARADGRPVANAWVRYVLGSRFASFWGGSTLAGWRGRGIYSQLVARRAAEARGRRVRFVYVEASDDSRPILQKLGFTALSRVTGYVRRP